MPNLLAKLLTRSFPGKAETQRGDLSSASRAAAEPLLAPPDDYESRALRLWTEKICGQSNPRILDMGCLHPKTLNFFQDHDASIGVMALDTSLAGTKFEMRLQQHAEWGPFEGVLCWDLLNYLAAPELRMLGDWLHRHCKPGALIMACLATRAPYASLPGQYAIEAEDRLSFVPSRVAQLRRSETHSSSELGKLWPGFESVRSFLLRNGMQEFVLRRSDGP